MGESLRSDIATPKVAAVLLTRAMFFLSMEAKGVGARGDRFIRLAAVCARAGSVIQLVHVGCIKFVCIVISIRMP